MGEGRGRGRGGGVLSAPTQSESWRGAEHPHLCILPNPFSCVRGKFSTSRTLKKNTLSNVMYIMLCYNVITILYCIPFIHSLLCARRPSNSLTSSVAHSAVSSASLGEEPAAQEAERFFPELLCQWVSLCRVLSCRGPSLRASVWWDRSSSPSRCDP